MQRNSFRSLYPSYLKNLIVIFNSLFKSINYRKKFTGFELMAACPTIRREEIGIDLLDFNQVICPQSGTGTD